VRNPSHSAGGGSSSRWRGPDARLPT